MAIMIGNSFNSFITPHKIKIALLVLVTFAAMC